MRFTLLSLLFIPLVTLIQSQTAFAQWQSEHVYYGQNGKLQYPKDSWGNRVPDFSYAGYKNNNETIPYGSVAVELSPLPGIDRTQDIQAAIDYAGAQATSEIKVILLRAGEYRVDGTLFIDHSNVILRGEDNVSTPENDVTLLVSPTDSNGVRDVYSPLPPPNHRTDARDNMKNNYLDETAIFVGTGNRSINWYPDGSSHSHNLAAPIHPGDKTIYVIGNASPSLQAGMEIAIVSPCTDEWLQAADDLTPNSSPGNPVGTWDDCGPDGDTYYSFDRMFRRTIQRVTYDSNNNTSSIELNSPLFDQFILDQFHPPYVEQISEPNEEIHNFAIENIDIDIQHNPSIEDDYLKSGFDPIKVYVDEAHVETGIGIYGVRDSWISGVKVKHYSLSGIFTRGVIRLSVLNSEVIDPRSAIGGGKRYAFHTGPFSQSILFSGCYSRRARHSFISNGAFTVSGIVFTGCTAEESFAPSESHQKWSQGVLFDNIYEKNPNTYVGIGLWNRDFQDSNGVSNDEHGWSAAHSVVWNSRVGKGNYGYGVLEIQQPNDRGLGVISRNYVIGYSGLIENDPMWPGDNIGEDPGIVEGHCEPISPNATCEIGLYPSSLFYAQLDDRQGAAGSMQDFDLVGDTYVRSGIYANNKYGSAELVSKGGQSGNYARKTYIQFDVSEYRDPESVWLKLRYQGVGGGGQGYKVDVFGLNNDNWEENTLTWNDQVGWETSYTANPLDSRTFNSGTPSELLFNVSDFVRSQSSADGVASFVVISNGPWMSFDSKEHGSKPPVLTHASPTSAAKLLDDTYVRDGSYEGNNYDGHPLVLKYSGTGYRRDIYMKFDLSDMPTPTRSYLKLYHPADLPLFEHEVEICYIYDETWSDSTLTWDYASNNLYLSWDCGIEFTYDNEGRYSTFDISDIVRDSHIESRNGEVSIVITGDENWIYYEDEGGDRPPSLIVEFIDDANGGQSGGGSSARVGEDELVGELLLEHPFPNPSNGPVSMFVHAGEVGSARIRVYDAIGRLVQILHEGKVDQGRTTISFDTSRLASGTYFVQAVSGDSGENRRVTTYPITVVK